MTAPQLLSHLRQRGIKLTACGNTLQYDAPKGELTPKDVEAIRLNKVPLLRLLDDNDHKAIDGGEIVEFDPRCWDSLPDPVDCVKCGSFGCWEDLNGDVHCITRNPPTNAIRLFKIAEQIRRRLGLPSPPGAREHFIELEGVVRRSVETPT